ncbi:urokinase plasminogen activator surface receptor-like isoform X2 [Poecilia formosa]|uniref:urokinase plasminogen activator surface receptor-like isoform X2 n=1 Tax=Poecilia formosa TaxID=48698 RepID=UPI0007B7F18E|nr:PREDICTED: urokinase plasminogen activator surface receptor-like isoform X2 [Poecilia formosa]
MFLFSLVLGLLFLPEADTLKCKCSPSIYGSCSGESECPSQNDHCLTATQTTIHGDKVSEHNVKSCMKAELCLDFSINNGFHRLLQKSSCCNGDLCNTQTDYPKPDNKSTPNGKKCFACDGENCMKTLNCLGDENYCVKVTGNVQGVSLTTKGCASKAVCSDQISSVVNQVTSRILGQVIGVKLSCCQGDYCNSASSASPVLLLLLVPLLFSNLFS